MLAFWQHVEGAGTWTKKDVEEGEQKCLWLTYIIEEGEHRQPVWLVSGLSEALVLVRIVMDDVELEGNAEQVRGQNVPK